MDLLTAIRNEPLSKIQDIVLKRGLSIDSTEFGYDVLNRALAYKRKDVAKWLIKEHCRVNKAKDSNPNMFDNTPLHNAVKLGDLEIVEMLLMNKASVVAVDSDDNSALHISFLYRYDTITDLLLCHMVENSSYVNVTNHQGLSHLHVASTRNNVKAIESFLNKANVKDSVKADIPSPWAGFTALHFAIEFKSLEAAEVLLAAGCKMKDNESRDTDQSPLQLLHQHLGECMIMSDHLYKNALPYFHLACLKGSATMVKKFIEKGADVNETIKWDTSLCNHYTPLQCALESPYDRKEKVQLLISHGATVEQAQCPGKHNRMTALHMAFYNEYHMNDLDSTIVDCLYKAVKNRKENIVDQNELSYFHIAVTRNDFDAVKFHLENGANVNQSVLQNDHGFSGYTAMDFALKYQLVDMVKFLIEHVVNVGAGENSERQTLFLLEAFRLGYISLIELQSKYGKIVDSSGNTFLHHAAKAGYHEIVKNLIDSGIYNINDQNNFKQIPLLLSLKVNAPSKEVVRILLEAAASLNVIDNCYQRHARRVVNSTKWLIEDMERLEIFKMFLETDLPNVHFDFVHYNVLEKVNERIVKLLIRNGIDLFAKDSGGTSLVHIFARNPNPGVIEQLRGQSFDVNISDLCRWTPLIYAAQSVNANAVEFLLDQGADIEAADVTNQTALYFAMKSADLKRQKCVQILLERGANAQIETVGVARPKILDVITGDKDSKLAELVLSHLAFQEANGTAITQLIRDKIESHERLKNYFKYCQQVMSVEIYGSFTLYNVLTSSERKLELYLKNEEMASKLRALQSPDYFNAILSKRLAKASAMVELKKSASSVVCKFMKTDYDRFPCIVDEIVGYLEKQDLENLILV